MNSNSQGQFAATCPKCGKKYKVDQRFVGKKVRCKQCEALFRILPSGGSESLEGSDLQGSGSVLTQSQLTTASTSGSGMNGRKSSSENSSSVNSPVENDEAWIGQRLGRFQITRLLGKGAMGVVFAAQDPDLKREVALKILAKQFIRDQKRTYRLEQFIREARSAAKLSHPNSVTVFEIGNDKGWFFIAMEIVEGGTLFDLVKKKRKHLELPVACELVAQAAEALSAAHRLGIIHRDIKPTNLMLTKEGRVKVADFGLVQMADREDDFDLPSKAVGTPYWMSPEQCRGETAVPQSDIYSLGAVMFFAATGEVPFKGKDRREVLKAHLEQPVPDVRLYRKDCPETLVRIIQRAMAKNPQERYLDAGEMAVGLRQLAANLHQAKLAERLHGILALGGGSGLSGRPKKASPLSTVVKTVILLALLAVAVGGFLYWRSLSPKPLPSPPPDRIQKPKPTPPPPPTKPAAPASAAVAKIPVYALPGEGIYHHKDCPRLKEAGVPLESLKMYDSEEAAKAANLLSCRYCQDLIVKEKQKAAKKKP